MLTLEEQFEKFAARVLPTRAFILEGRTACDRCGFLFGVPVLFASGQNIMPRTIAEPTSTVCPRCEIAAQGVRAP